MHIFLTGEIGIGKSLVIERALNLLHLKVGGFQTSFGPTAGSPEKILYLNDASLPPVFSEETAVAHFSPVDPPRISTARFDTYGAGLIRAAKACDLILMDECGFLEAGALTFREEIFRALDGDTTVLGVIKVKNRSWTEAILRHPRVEILKVNRVNRDLLPARLAKRLAEETAKGGTR